MKRIALVLFLLAPSVCAAQQPAQPPPSMQDQLLTVCTNISSSLAKQLDTAHAQIEALTKQLADAKEKATPKSEVQPQVPRN